MKLNKSDIQKIILSLLGLLFFFVLLINEIPHFFNVFNLPLILSVSSGLALISALLFASKMSEKADELIEKFQIYVASIIICLILFPLIINFTNRIYSIEVEETFTFISVQEMYGLNLKGSVRRGEIPEPSAYIVRFERANGSVENIRFTKNITEDLYPGDKLTLAVNKGLFGIRFVVTD